MPEVLLNREAAAPSMERLEAGVRSLRQRGVRLPGSTLLARQNHNGGDVLIALEQLPPITATIDSLPANHPLRTLPAALHSRTVGSLHISELPAGHPLRVLPANEQDQTIASLRSSYRGSIRNPAEREQQNAKGTFERFERLRTLRALFIRGMQQNDAAHANFGHSVEYMGLIDAVNRMRNYSQANGNEANPANEKQRQELLALTVQMDMRITLLHYEEALIADFVDTVEKYVEYWKRPENAGLRARLPEAVRKNLEESERTTYAILRELDSTLPALSTITQVRMFDQMLEQDTIARALDVEITAGRGAQRVNQLPATHPLRTLLAVSLHTETINSLRRAPNGQPAYRLLTEQARPGEPVPSRAELEGNVKQLRQSLVTLAGEHANSPDLVLRGAARALVAAPNDRAAMDEYSNQVERRIRDMFGIGAQWNMAGGGRGSQESRVANNMYNNLLLAHADLLYGDVRANRSNTATLERMDALYGEAIGAEMDYQLGALRTNADFLSLLATRRHIGPLTRPQLPVNPILSPGERTDYQRNPLPQQITKELNDEWQRSATGFSEYCTALESAVNSENSNLARLRERIVDVGNRGADLLSIPMMLANRIAWAIPDNAGARGLARLGTPIPDWAQNMNVGDFVREVGRRYGAQWATLDEAHLRELSTGLQDMLKRVGTMRGILDAYMAPNSPSATARNEVRSHISCLRTLTTNHDPATLALSQAPIYPAADVQTGAALMQYIQRLTPANYPDAQELQSRVSGAYLYCLHQINSVHVPALHRETTTLVSNLRAHIRYRLGRAAQMDQMDSLTDSIIAGVLTSMGTVWGGMKLVGHTLRGSARLATGTARRGLSAAGNALTRNADRPIRAGWNAGRTALDFMINGPDTTVSIRGPIRQVSGLLENAQNLDDIRAILQPLQQEVRVEILATLVNDASLTTTQRGVLRALLQEGGHTELRYLNQALYVAGNDALSLAERTRQFTNLLHELASQGDQVGLANRLGAARGQILERLLGSSLLRPSERMLVNAFYFEFVNSSAQPLTSAARHALGMEAAVATLGENAVRNTNALNGLIDTVHALDQQPMTKAYTSLREAHEQLRVARNSGGSTSVADTAVREAEREVTRILQRKQQRLIAALTGSEFGLSPRDARRLANALVRTGVCGLEGGEGIATSIQALREAEEAVRAAPATGITGAVRAGLRNLHPGEAWAVLTMRPNQTTQQLLLAAQEVGLVEDVTPGLLRMIDQSPSAQRIMAGAIEQARTGAQAGAEIETALRAARTARNWMIAGNTIGVGAEMFGFVMAYMEYRENGRLAMQTTNPGLRDLYGSMQVRNIVEMGVSATCLAWNGVAIAVAINASGSVLVGLSTAATAAALPLAIAAAAGSYFARQAEGVTREWFSTAREFVSKSDGEILQRLAEIAPGQFDYYQGWAANTRIQDWWNWANMDEEQYRKWTEQGAKTIEGANTATRNNYLEAYFLRNAHVARQQGEQDGAYNLRLNTFVRDAQDFMSHSAGGTPSGQNLRFAQAYAEMMSVSRTLAATGDSQMISWTVEGEQHSVDLAQVSTLDWQSGRGTNKLSAVIGFMIFKQEVRANEVQSIVRRQQQNPEENPEAARSSIRSILLQEVAQDLYRLDGLSRAAHGTGVSSRVFRYSVYLQLRDAIRRETELHLGSSTITPDAMRLSIDRLRAVFPRTVSVRNEFYRPDSTFVPMPAWDAEFHAHDRTPDRDRTLDPQWIGQHLDLPQERAHPHGSEAWDGVAQLLVSRGAVPAQFEGSMNGYRLSIGARTYEFTSVAGRVNWRSPPQHMQWQRINDPRSQWQNEPNADYAEANSMARTLIALESGAENIPVANSVRREGMLLFTEIIRADPTGPFDEVREITVDGRPAYRLSADRRTVEITSINGVWLWRFSDRPSREWCDPRRWSTGFPTLDPVVARLRDMNGIQSLESHTVINPIRRAEDRFRDSLRALEMPRTPRPSSPDSVGNNSIYAPRTNREDTFARISREIRAAYPDLRDCVQMEEDTDAPFVIRPANSSAIRVRFVLGDVQWRLDTISSEWVSVNSRPPYDPNRGPIPGPQSETNRLLRYLASAIN